MSNDIKNSETGSISIESRDPGLSRMLVNILGNDQEGLQAISMGGIEFLSGPILLDALDTKAFRPNDASMNTPTREEIDAKIVASEAKIDARLANFDTSIKTGFADLATAMARQSAAMEKQTDAVRVEMAKQSGDVRTEMAAIRAEMHKGTADLLKWGAGIAFAAVASTVGLLTYINKSVEKPSQVHAPAQASAPLVVAVPAGSTILNTAPNAPAVVPIPPVKQNN